MLRRPRRVEVERCAAVGRDPARPGRARPRSGTPSPRLPQSYPAAAMRRNRPEAAYCSAMRRLRSLSEAECYARCYGGWDATVQDRQTRAATRARRARDRRRGAAASASRSSSKRVTPPSSPSPKQPELGRSRTSSRPDLRVLFCGINPGRVSAAAAAHFANPRNDFWRLLHAAGFTPRLLEPPSSSSFPTYGIGVTNAAARTTPGSGDLRKADFAGAAERLERIASELQPAWIGFVGKEAYRGAFGERPELGAQERRARRHAALRAAVDLAGERRGALGRAPALVSSARRPRLAAPAVRDRRSAVAAERLRAQLHARRRLAALVLRPVDHRRRRARRRRGRSRPRRAPRACGRARRTARAPRRASGTAAASPRRAGCRAARRSARGR